MRLPAALLTVASLGACLAACGTATPQPDPIALRPDDEWRERQATLDADAILQGMAQARLRREEIARISR